MIALVIDIVDDGDETAEVGEERAVDDVAAARRTRNPGLDRSPLLSLKTGEVILNRRTYFALMVRLPSVIEMVQAKLPGDPRSMLAVYHTRQKLWERDWSNSFGELKRTCYTLSEGI